MKERTFRDILTSFPGKRVLIVGDVMLDEYIFGEVHRVSPEAPVPVVEISSRSDIPGGAGNVAVNVTSLRGKPLLCGAIGSDQQADRLQAALKQYGVETEGLVVDSQRPTTTKSRVVAHSQQLARLDHELRTPLRTELEAKVLRWIRRRLSDADICVLSDYGKGVISPKLAQRLILLARRAGKFVVVDPKGSDYAKYRGATLVTPNVYEAGKAVNHEIRNESDLWEVGRQLLGILKGSALLITQGPQGMTLLANETQIVHIPSTARSVFDVTGAGDTVVSTLSMCLAAYATLEQAAHIANRAAGIVVEKFGTSSVSLPELFEDIVRDDTAANGSENFEKPA